MRATLKVKTGFNTQLLLDTQTLGKRILAFLIDAGVIILYIYLLMQLLAQFDLDFRRYSADADRIAWGLWSLIFLPVMFYTLLFETLTGGYTIGKYLLKIKVVKINGFQPGFTDFFIRWIFRVVDIYFFLILMITFNMRPESAFLFLFLSGLVAVIVISRSKSSQRLGDLVAGTAVVTSKQVQNINITILQNVSEDYVPKYSQVLKLSDNDARIIKETFEVALKNRDDKLIQKLVDKLESVMNVSRNEPNKEFIRRVLKDFNYFTQKM